MKYAVVSVVTDDFIPGTLVTLGSFLKENTWFKGDICLIGKDVQFARIKNVLGYNRIKIVRVSEALNSRCEELISVHEQYRRRVAQFYSLEVFRLEGYDRVLFLDSDLLIRGNVQGLFSSSSKLLACGDGYYYKGFSHHRVTFEKLECRAEVHPEGMNAFNAGVMSIDGKLISRSTYHRMIEMISVEYFNRFSTNHSDQLVFNLLFENEVEFISSVFNYRIGVDEEMKEMDGSDLESALIIHYTARKKPWRLMEALKAAKRNASYVQTYLWWHEVWNELMLLER